MPMMQGLSSRTVASSSQQARQAGSSGRTAMQSAFLRGGATGRWLAGVFCARVGRGRAQIGRGRCPDRVCMAPPAARITPMLHAPRLPPPLLGRARRISVHSARLSPHPPTNVRVGTPMLRAQHRTPRRPAARGALVEANLFARVSRIARSYITSVGECYSHL